MRHRDSKEWNWPPADQWLTAWGGLAFFIVGVFTSEAFDFLSRLTGTPWICCYLVGLAVATLGVSLIFYAKLPLYRQGRFLTFGSRGLPEERRPFYRWGYRCGIVGAGLLACLLFSTR